MLSQSRKASIVEACANTLIGLFIQASAQAFLFLVMKIPITTPQFIWFTLIMTVLSVARSYVVRRMWNAEWWKRFKRAV